MATLPETARKRIPRHGDSRRDDKQWSYMPDAAERPQDTYLRHAVGSSVIFEHACDRSAHYARVRLTMTQERAPDYQVLAAWSAFLIFIGAGAFVLGMAIHNETLATQSPPRPEPIYYCAAGDEMPAFEPCRDRKD
jgi:hypothetical protein